MICLVEVRKENWSFGNGIAQYAKRSGEFERGLSAIRVRG